MTGATAESPARRTYVDATGLDITFYVWEAAVERGVVQLAHGHGEHARRYDELARRLTASGYTVYADDHRGHGETGRSQWGGDLTRIGVLGAQGLRATVDAVAQLSTIIRAERPQLPLTLLAHSWGSILGQMILNKMKAEYDAVVFTGTVYRLPGSMGAGDFNRKHGHPGATGYEWLSRDAEVARAAAADPLMPLITAVQAFGIRDALGQYGRPARSLRPFPLLIMVGDDDTFGGAESARRLATAYRKRSGLKDVTLHIYSDARHEVFNETNRVEVMDDLIDWLERRLDVAAS